MTDELPEDPPSTEQAPESPGPALSKLGGAFVGLLQGHLELLGIEIQEEKARIFRLLALFGICLVFGLMMIFGLSVVVLILFWDTYRLPAAIGLCVFFAVVLMICLSMALRLLKTSESPFRSTLAELARDKERLLP